jgi:hypothetical protein
MDPVRPPAVNPCGSCPYRCDVPSGVWSDEEYEKLPPYDGPTHEQPPSVFMCHQADGRLCAGWTACHDMDESMGFRMSVLVGQIREEDIDIIREYRTSVPIFTTGAEAAAHGMAEIYNPPDEARKIIDKLHKKRGF